MAVVTVHGVQVLDVAPRDAIVPASVKLAARVVSWTRDGVAKSRPVYG